jgi:putative phosphoesterase
MNLDCITGTGVIGVISDTHGLLRPEAARILSGADIIVHAGDIGPLDVIKSLETIAPVTAVHGNTDSGIIASFFNDSETLEFKGLKIHLLHDLSHLSVDPAKLGVRLVISGHSHMPMARKKNSVMYLNPGSAGPKRKDKPISLATVTLRDDRLQIRHFDLEEFK